MLWLLEIATSTACVSLVVLSSLTMYRLLLCTFLSVGFVVDKMILGKVVFMVAELSAASIAPVMLHTHFHRQSFSSQQTNWRSPECFLQNLEIDCNIRIKVYRCSFSGIRRSTQNKFCHIFFKWFLFQLVPAELAS